MANFVLSLILVKSKKQILVEREQEEEHLDIIFVNKKIDISGEKLC